MQIELLDIIDEKKTRKEAIKVLKKYSRLRRIAGEEYAPKITISYSLEPRSSSGQVSKQVENMVVRRVSAQQDLEVIAKAINSLSNLEYTRILIERYCRKNRREDYSIYSELGYSSSEYYRILNKALLEFAESYQARDLLVYKRFLGKSWEKSGKISGELEQEKVLK